MPAVKFVARIGAALLLLATSLACSSAGNDTDRAKLEKDFEDSMRNVVLDGCFTVHRNGETHAGKEKYTIKSVSKLAGDIWTFQARIQYGDHDVTLPVPVQLLWAGDTPMVSLTDTSIPGLGTFTARVMFYRNSYAGFWQHGDVWGNQFGKILRGESALAAAEAAPPESESCSACSTDEAAPKPEGAEQPAAGSEKTPK